MLLLLRVVYLAILATAWARVVGALRALRWADRLIFLPMHGFTESLNVSVATALVLQRLLDACPESRGQLPPKELGLGLRVRARVRVRG